MKKLPPHILADNRAARFHFEILETFEAGIILTGKEVKSLRAKSAKLSGSFLAIRDGEVWLKNFEIPEYKFARGQPHEKLRNKKLLLTAKEIAKIEKSLNEKGITAVPLDIHLSHSKIKVKVALARGKKKWDKREVIKKRDIEREIRREAKAR